MAEAVKGGSVMQTTAVALPVGAGLAIAQYLVAPSWPPPEPILAITVAATAPLWHLLGRAIYLRVASWAGEEANVAEPLARSDEGASPNGGSAEAAPTPPPPTPNILASPGPLPPPTVVPMTPPQTATGATP